MKKINFGSNIKFTGNGRTKKNGMNYEHIASSYKKYLDTIFLNKSNYWLKTDEKKIIEEGLYVLSHEPIHCILWHHGIMEDYDYLIRKFKRITKKQCPKTHKHWRFSY